MVINLCIDCGRRIHFSSLRCRVCANKGENNPCWRGGKPKCKDCSKQLSDWRAKYCLICMNKGKRNPRYDLHEFAEKSPNWQGGKTVLIKIIASLKKYNIWRIKCFKRDKFTCQKCHSTKSGKLNVHHKITLSHLLKIYTIKTIKQAIKCKQLWKIQNGITLCTKCHAKIHGKSRRKIKVIYTSGSFDLPHVGHTNILKKARALGDILIVGVSTNRLIKKYKGILPVISYKDRASLIKDLRYVDKIIKQDTFFDIEQLRPLKIDIIVLGSDWKGKKFIELENCLKELHIKMVYLPYTSRLSSSKIKEKIIKNAVEIIKAGTKR